MTRLFAFGTIAALLFAYSAPAGAQTPPASSPGPLVSTEWLQQHLKDPNVRIVATGDEGRYSRGHIPGARFVAHMDTVNMNGGHRVRPAEVPDGSYACISFPTPCASLRPNSR